MRSRTIFALTVLAVTASACATAAPEAPTGVTSSGSPAPVEGYDWFFHADAAAARLAYGLAESDDLRLGLDCDRGSGRLTLSGTASTGARPEFHVEAGGETARFPARAEPSQLHDGVFLSGEAAADAPVFQRFRRVGWLALWQDGKREAYAPHPASAPNIERFFAFCG
ncbi:MULTISPECIES: hypothetical protein [unclassified Brevundimonas]|uniref:hypothetical protein n=1 Tax=unclassified Brevundimonas TaxID=2622653 RepID=UPI0007006BB2|nr:MULTISPECIES: hypothetical protein [unclassified Brevundimonas]KQY66804.1 hypothetical protein ASD25_14825 [Brevundimonas sp. Root1423]KRA22793.1 hypothetical protein ASD59_09175 [Brevundimonas sp. Root608]